MTFNETYFAFDDEVERIEDEIEQLDEKLADLQDGDASPGPQATALAEQKQQLASQRKGVIWARDRAYDHDDFPCWDEDVDGVTLGAIRAGAYGRLTDDLEQDPTAGSGTSTTLLVVEGTVTDPDAGEEAPYVGTDMTADEETAAVASLHPFFRAWAENRISTLMDPESGNEIF